MAGIQQADSDPVSSRSGGSADGSSGTPGTSTSHGGSQSALRERNIAALTTALRTAGPQHQAALARATGLSRATVSNLVGLEVAAGRFTSQRLLAGSHWATIIALADDGYHVAGVDIGRTHLHLALSNTDRSMHTQRRFPLPVGHHPADTFATVRRLLDEMLADEGIDRSHIRRVGICIPASISSAGYVVQETVFTQWAGVNIASLAAEVLAMDVVVDNDANLGALAHGQLDIHGQVDNRGTLVYVKLASGIGAGIMVGDQLYHSTSGLVGEIGHVQVSTAGQICYCGARGCLETLASTRSVVADYSQVHGVEASIDDVVAALEREDRAAVRIVAEAGDALGRVLAMVCNLLGPSVIVVGGPLVDTSPILIDAVVAAVHYRVQPDVMKATQFQVSRLGARAEVIGACLAAHCPPRGAAQAHSISECI